MQARSQQHSQCSPVRSTSGSHSGAARCTQHCCSCWQDVSSETCHYTKSCSAGANASCHGCKNRSHPILHRPAGRAIQGKLFTCAQPGTADLCMTAVLVKEAGHLADIRLPAREQRMPVALIFCVIRASMLSVSAGFQFDCNWKPAGSAES